MIEALNMQLEAVRTVLSNEVNEITVCVDQKRKSGVFYTMISITSASVRLRVAGILASDSVLATNNDFIGSFAHGDCLSLVFLYRQENLLARREELYGTTFPLRKKMAENLLVSLAETQLTGAMGLLLLAERNINVEADGSVYFNYFLDFNDWKPETDNANFFRKTAQLCCEILSRDYQLRYGGDRSSYPGELQVFAKKADLKSFLSFSAILSVVKSIPDVPTEPSVGWRKWMNRIRRGIKTLRDHSMTIFLAAVVLTTVVYATYQITLRLSYRSAYEKNTTYIGMETIGEIYLGDEML